MATFILSVAFSIAMYLEATAYAIYEIIINKNKSGGIVLLVLSLVALIFPIIMYVKP